MGPIASIPSPSQSDQPSADSLWRRISCTACGKLYALVSPGDPDRARLVLLEPLHCEPASHDSGAVLRCDCGVRTLLPSDVISFSRLRHILEDDVAV